MRAFTPKGARYPVLTSNNPKLKDWQQLVAMCAQEAMGRGDELMAGPVMVALSVTLPRPKSLPKKATTHVKKPDLDKVLRSVFDALTGVVFRDDSQVVELIARKRYAAELAPPGAFITVEELI